MGEREGHERKEIEVKAEETEKMGTGRKGNLLRSDEDTDEMKIFEHGKKSKLERICGRRKMLEEKRGKEMETGGVRWGWGGH